MLLRAHIGLWEIVVMRTGQLLTMPARTTAALFDATYVNWALLNLDKFNKRSIPLLAVTAHARFLVLAATRTNTATT